MRNKLFNKIINLKKAGKYALEIKNQKGVKTLHLFDEEDLPRVWGRRWFEKSGGYATTIVRYEELHKQIPLSYFILGYPPFGYVIDHIDRDKRNCLRQNLRIVTEAQNIMNRQLKNPASGRVGVYKTGDRYYALCGKKDNGKPNRIGFDTFKEAVAARENFEKFVVAEMNKNDFDEIRKKTGLLLIEELKKYLKRLCTVEDK